MTKVINFSKNSRLMVILSVVLILAGIIGTVLQGGFNLGIDFQAGLSQRIRIDSPAAAADIAGVRETLAGVAGIGAEVQMLGSADDQEYTVRVRDDGSIEDFKETVSQAIVEALEAEYGAAAAEILERSYVGPRFSTDLTAQVVWLIGLAMSVILLYLWFRFRIAYALSAVVALLHDILFMIGFIGVFQIELTSATIAAILTIVGYSLNDTIVIFDRIRENESVVGESKLQVIIDGSITQSLSRTLITSITTFVAVLAIFIFTTGQIQDFALALMVGIVVGTYSSIYIASLSFYAITVGMRARAKRREALAGMKPAGKQKTLAAAKKK